MNSLFAILLALSPSLLSLDAAPEQPLRLEEVLSVVRSNLTDVSEGELGHAAALGVLEHLGARIQLAGTNAPGETVSNAVTKAAVYGQNFGYLRISAVPPGLADALEKSWNALSATNSLKGVILDLRYAKGGDFAAAAEAAGLFIFNEQLLFRTGAREFRTTKSTRKIKGPVAALINGETSGPAEALAGALRESGAALLIGSHTSGEARLFETVELSTGHKLRIGRVPVEIGGQVISTNGVAPDISVNVNSLDERAYFQDPYVVIPRGFTDSRGTNDLGGARARRITEADLVRRHREGLDVTASEETISERDPRIIMDPALARAVDFLKGLAVLRQAGAE